MGEKDNLWRILDIDADAQTALVIAAENAENRQYHEKQEDVTWETCDLRKWLNTTYYDNAFSGAEKAAILESEVQNPDNPDYPGKGGNETRDRLFLLSIEEWRKYDCPDLFSGWLRTPGVENCEAAVVDHTGCLRGGGVGVSYINGVYPACRINMRSEFFLSLMRQVV